MPTKQSLLQPVIVRNETKWSDEAISSPTRHCEGADYATEAISSPACHCEEAMSFADEAISPPARHCEEALLFHADEAIAFTVLSEVLSSTLSPPQN